MQATIIGTGYVGLVSGVCFSDFGHNVICVDNDLDKITGLKRGQSPIYEPGLEALMQENVAAGRLQFTTDTEMAVAQADVVFIAVGTPSRRGDGHADLSYVHAAADEIARFITDYTVIVTKSTVPVGTGDAVEARIKALRPDADFSVVSNPEFLREGAAINDFKRPDRIVIGTDEPRAIEIMRQLYRPLYLNETPILVTSRRSSELIKYAANAFLATKISFINEMADLCEKVGANVQDISRGIGLDNRIGSKFLHAGPGYGGSCFPKDTKAVIKTAQDYGAPLQIIETVERVNDQRKQMMVERILTAFDGQVDGRKIAILGLSFKPNTDDMRCAPSLDIIPALQKHGAHIRAYDPEAMTEAKGLLDHIDYADGIYDCLDGADAVVILTEWDQFRALDLMRVKNLLKAPIFIDLRNIYRPDDMQALGFDYISIGRN